MKTRLLLAALASALMLPSCTSTGTPGQPTALYRAERRIYATPTQVSDDPTSPLYHVAANGSSASVALAKF